MKKLISFLLLVTLMAVSLCGCNTTPICFTGEWKFASIEKVELQPDLEQSMIDLLKEQYNAEDEDGIVANALDTFTSEGTFNSFYLKFDNKEVYTYDVAFEREATWVLYQLTEKTGFISFYTELDTTDGNPYPVICPDLTYNAETDTMVITMNHLSFMVTLTLVR